MRSTLAYHQGEPGSIPGWFAPGSSHVGVVPHDAVGRRVFPGDLPFFPPQHSVAAPNSPLSTLIGSQDLDVKNLPDLLSHSRCGGAWAHPQGPSFLLEPPGTLEFANSSGAVLSCAASGQPPPDIRWLDSALHELTHLPRLSILAQPIRENGFAHITAVSELPAARVSSRKSKVQLTAPKTREYCTRYQPIHVPIVAAGA
ncbi:hypothetical protein PR048_024401 [Dryococelus australis]|uniref:Ig-like domain-containing protein n=1 Tax=Dryococelus australis TaxID=614101 RepID=A0ABQ9GNI4_9NEOP|nr:hypothetical protein PR048_024401 [Dryococelus australis]